MWTYSQSMGVIRDGNKLEGEGYSGHDGGLNNGDMESIPDIGPIPRGRWEITHWYPHYEGKGPIVGRLAPIGHDAHGRAGFLIHGDNRETNHSASHGCIVAARSIREAWRDSGDPDLEVIA